MNKGMYNDVPVLNRVIIGDKVFKPEVVDGDLLFPMPVSFGGFDIIYIRIGKEVLLQILKDNDDLK